MVSSLLLLTTHQATIAASNRPESFQEEAQVLTERMFETFYDSGAGIWCPKVVPTAESVVTQGYTLWPSLVAWQLVIEAAKVNPEKWRSKIAPHYDSLEKYYDEAESAS
ncbi:MAG: hypothetical protein MUC92_01975 [Fimbriimonadaceae bacterium]|jgi:hypothetical protein|nr:hypothetical protein [Fimbriimonadaceae bacterium]